MINQYVLILIWIGFMALLSKSFYREEYVIEQWERRISPIFAFVVFVPVIWMAANRGYFADTTVYLVGYHQMPNTLSELPAFIESQPKDAGYGVLAGFLHVIFGNEDVLFLGTVTLLQAAGLIYLFRKYSIDYVFSVFLFIASADYISWMFNGLRQFLAATIILFATPFMLKRKYLQVILIILLASTLHKSALIMIPFVIISQGEAWNKRTLFFLFTAILAMVFVEQFTNLLNDSLQNTQYVNVVSDYTGMGDDGTNPIRVVVYSLPALISLWGRRKIKDSGDFLINFCTNMSIISMGIYLVSMVTSGVFIGRLPIYVSLYGYVLLPWEIENIFEWNRKSVYFMCVVGYLIYYYVQMHLTYGLF